MGKHTAEKQTAGESPVDRWLRVKRVFLEALEFSDERRSAYLAEACSGDEDLRAEVESLLNCHVQAVEGGFLDSLPGSSSPRAVLEAMAAAFDATSAHTQKDEGSAATASIGYPSVVDIPTGDCFGDYLLLEPVGQGGMGVVYRARQLSLNRVVAIKMIRAGRFSTPGEIERFAREAEAAAGLTHPGIVPVFEIGEEEGHHYYTMAFVEGVSLADYLKEAGGPLEPKRSAELIRQIADAMQYAHEHGVIHRDLKPANILLDENEDPRVMDFGLAKQIEIESGLTMTGQVLGTPSFMSPEQAAGETANVGVAADVYSIGAVFYALLTGRPPFSAATVSETLRQVQNDEPVRPRQLNSALPKDLETICLKCLTKDPSKRYPSARDLADELTRYLSGRPILARPVGPIATTARWCRRNPLAASFMAFVAVFVPVVIVALLWMNFTLSKEKTRAESEKRMADSSFRAAKDAVDEQFTLVSQETLLHRSGLQPLRRQLLLGAQKYYRKFLTTNGDDDDVQAEAALIHFRLGVITATLSTDSGQDAYAEALEYFAQARKIYQALPNQDDPHVLEGLGDVATRAGQIYNRLQQPHKELAAFQRALELRRRLLDVEDGLESRRRWANANMNLGQALLPADPWEDSLHYAAAIAHLETAQTIRRALRRRYPDDASLVRDQVKGYILIADSLAIGQASDVERNLMAAFEALDSQAAKETPTLEDTYLRAIVARRLGASIADTATSDADRVRARDKFEQALEILTTLSQENPQVVDYLSALAATYFDSALILQDLQQFAEARARLHTALKLFDPLLKGRNPDDILRWAGAHTILAEMEPADSVVAIDHLRTARTLLIEKLEAIAGDANERTVQEEYLAAVAEIDQLLAERPVARENAT